MTFKEIVDEVIRRIEAIENRKNMLLIFHPDTRLSLLEEVLVKIDRRHLKVGIISIGDTADLQDLLNKMNIEVINLIAHEDHIQMDYLMKRYDSVFVTGLSLGELYNISVMNIQSKTEKLLMAALMDKGKIYALKSIESNRLLHKEGLVKRLDNLYEVSSEMGFEWFGHARVGNEFLQNVITCDLLSGSENRQIKIASTSVLTPLAKEYVKKHEIEIIRK